MLLPLLRATRNGIAFIAAQAFVLLPPLEPLFLRVSRAFSKKTILRNFHLKVTQEAIKSLTKKKRDLFRSLAFDNHKVSLHINTFSGLETYLFDEWYELNTTRLIMNTVAEGDVFIDIGACHGYFSLLAGRLIAPTGKVFAFEPNPFLRDIFMEGILKNDLVGNVELMPFALGDVNGNARLMLSNDPWNVGLSTIAPRADSFKNKHVTESNCCDVQVRKFDDWWAVMNPDSARNYVVKIDVEGAEESVIRGMSNFLRSTENVTLICELSTESPCKTLLTNMGFQSELIENVSPGVDNFVFRRLQ